MTGFLKDERYHDPSGAVLGGGTRHSIDFRRDGRTYEIPLERDRSDDFYIRADAAWDEARRCRARTVISPSGARASSAV